MSVITNPSISSVGQALADLQTSVGTLCVSTHINKWAKSKPFRAFNGEKYFVNQSAMRNAARLVNYGISEPNIVTGHPENAYVDNDWAYQRPRGVNSNYDEPYRLGDFRGYNHGAVAPIIRGVNTIDVNTFWGTGILSCTVGVGGDDIQISDLKVDNTAVSDYYLAITWEKSGTRYIKIATATLGNSGTSISLASEFSTAGTYNAVICGANSNSATVASGNFIPLPCADSDKPNFATAIINVATNAQMHFTIDKIYNYATSQWDDFSKYATHGGTDYYWPTDSLGQTMNGRIFIEITLRNNASNARTIETSAFRWSANHSIVSGSAPTDKVTPSVYDENGNLLTQTVTIPANSSIKLRLDYVSNQKGLLLQSGSKTEGAGIRNDNTTISLYIHFGESTDKSINNSLPFKVRSNT